MINIGNDWQPFFDAEQQKPFYKNLRRFLAQEYATKTVYPPMQDIFKAFELTPIHNTKVVIIGQDCYHGEGQAMGLSFSVRNGVCPTPPSLKNIQKELNSETVERSEWSQDLTRWAEQGVLLLNTILTVRQHEPLSHANQGWEILTDDVIKELEKYDQPIVYLLWGRNAGAKKNLITNQNHKFLESAHPSPLSANRGFFGNNHFAKANEFLIENGLEPVRW